MTYAGPDWPVIIVVAVIVVLAAATVVLSSRRLRMARTAGRRLAGIRLLQLAAIVIGALAVLWLIVSLVGNIAMSMR